MKQDEMLEPRSGPSNSQPRGSTRSPGFCCRPRVSLCLSALHVRAQVCWGRGRGFVCTAFACSNCMVPDEAESRLLLKG